MAAFPGYRLTVDLERQLVIKPDGTELPFEVQAFRKYCLLSGLRHQRPATRGQDQGV